ncbi:hypothetical protein QTP88_026511 [Uroleucon formosanum]
MRMPNTSGVGGVQEIRTITIIYYNRVTRQKRSQAKIDKLRIFNNSIPNIYLTYTRPFYFIGIIHLCRYNDKTLIIDQIGILDTIARLAMHYFNVVTDYKQNRQFKFLRKPLSHNKCLTPKSKTA